MVLHSLYVLTFQVWSRRQVYSQQKHNRYGTVLNISQNDYFVHKLDLDSSRNSFNRLVLTLVKSERLLPKALII